MATCAELKCPNPTEAQCHCPLCHQTFGTLEYFDGHLIHVPRLISPTGCRTPVSLGLVRDERYVWRTPAGLARRNADAARLAARLEARRALRAPEPVS